MESPPDSSKRLPMAPLADAIRAELRAADASWRDAIGHAVKAGELLVEQSTTEGER